MPLDRLQLKINAFSGKLNVCSRRILMSWIRICCNFTLQTQIFTQKYRSWLRFYSRVSEEKIGGWSLCYQVQVWSNMRRLDLIWTLLAASPDCTVRIWTSNFCRCPFWETPPTLTKTLRKKVLTNCSHLGKYSALASGLRRLRKSARCLRTPMRT